ncbi:hypothetical protein HWI79_3277 [Cryptosporidium felis]|nr:hypothetical protein HWI79_3277 [Cryptosporidium felis]
MQINLDIPNPSPLPPRFSWERPLFSAKTPHSSPTQNSPKLKGGFFSSPNTTGGVPRIDGTTSWLTPEVLGPELLTWLSNIFGRLSERNPKKRNR